MSYRTIDNPLFKYYRGSKSATKIPLLMKLLFVFIVFEVVTLVLFADSRTKKIEETQTSVDVINNAEKMEPILPTVIADERKRTLQPIQKIVLIGERHSGTKWIKNEIVKCFPEIITTDHLIRGKHWFQRDDGKDRVPTLVVAQFRNVFDWVVAMGETPYHSPNHIRVRFTNSSKRGYVTGQLPWKEFVTRKWTMARPKEDLEMRNNKNATCWQGWKYDEAVSCTKKYDIFLQPVYEMKLDGSGEPFESILELRAAKIKNFLSVGHFDWVKQLISVQYEKLVVHGTEPLLKEIEEITGMSRQCEPSPPKKLKRKRTTKKFDEWIIEHTDWETEGLIGYDKHKMNFTNMTKITNKRVSYI